VLGRDALPEVQERLRTVPGVTVIIYDQRCAAQARRLRKRGQLTEPPRRVIINEAVCEGCGDCGVKSNCLSVLPVATEFGDKRQIHDPSCNRDYSCLEGDCPSFVTISPRREPGGTTHRNPPKPAARGGSRVRLPSSARPVSPAVTRPAGALPAPASPVVERRSSVYFTGIGGTGVVTASRIISAIGESAGLVIGGVDQTGLSQKAGAVVSHLHLARTTASLGAATVASDDADVYLSGDVLQAATARHLAKIRPGHTVVVVDPDLTPTASMLQGGVGQPDIEELKAAITGRASGAPVAFVESKRIAEAAFNDHLLANVILAGAAYQLGGLPGSPDDVERAMSRQGKSAAVNREAFEWGRWAAHDPDAVEAALRGRSSSRPAGPFEPSGPSLEAVRELVRSAGLPDGLRELLTRRAAQVADYQDARLARRYLALVERVAARDDGERGWALTRAVAESWFKLLTYKDEYEVARLHVAVDYDQVARDLGIEGPYTLKYQLHPPFLRRLGLKRKLPMGMTYAVGFQVLARMKRLRGTPLDFFGWDRDRRMERSLIAEYEQLIERAAALPYDTAVQLAESAQAVKGYAVVKEAAVARWRSRVAALLEQDAHSDQAAGPVRAGP
jgi:indolepyruvate ferredoxin oxidoreductase